MKNNLLNYDNRTDSPTLMLVVLLATLGSLSYLFFILNPANAGNPLPYAIVIFAELFIVTQALIAMWTILSGNSDPRGFGYHDAQEHLFSQSATRVSLESVKKNNREGQLYLGRTPVSVDVFVTVYGEPLETIEKTVVAAKNILGHHVTYILDDGKSDEVMELARKLKVKYVRRKENKNAKAGNINNILSKTEADFFVIFDADFVAKENFLYETIPFFEDPNLAFVQTPQHYVNINNLISRGAGYMQRLFYRFILPGKNRFNSAFCVGTNVVYRRTAVDEVGGIYDKSKSEDIWTSLMLHERGWRSVFLSDILAEGNTPDSIETYAKQQLRWATGGMQIFFKHNPLFIKGLNIDQRIQYLSTSAYYLHGVAIFGLLMLPPLHIFFNLTPVDLSTDLLTWASVYLGFYGLQILLAFYAMGGFRIETLVLAMVSFPIYIKALFNALRGREESWSATGRAGMASSPFNYIIPQVMLFVFLFATTLVELWKTYYYQSLSLSLFWAALNTVVFGSFMIIAMKEHRQIARANKRVKQQLQTARSTG